AAALHPDRILLDKNFMEAAKNARNGVDIQDLMIKNCAVTDIAGTLYAEKAVARKSTVEFGWVVGIPEYTRTEQYFHVKYDPSRGSGTGTESVAGTQAIFHRPASSGVYALVSHLELYRIGRNDISRQSVVSKENRKARMRAAIQALGATLIAPRGAQRNTQFPHITSAEGV
ncbi:MAG: DevR family CRISPR-associated autoregulator, partial [Armatimonadota bacterium]